MKGYSTFAKALGIAPGYQRQFSVISRTLAGESYPSAEMKSEYPAIPAELEGYG